MPGVRDPALLRSISAEIKARRAVLKISQEELAHRAGLNPSFIAKLEVCQNQPSLTAFLYLAKGLDAKPAELLAAVLLRHRKELRAQARRP
jgi:transcriptional regulator with XRE-family HTH domain